MDASMWALVAEMNAINAGVQGMAVENTERQNNGCAMAYDESAFADAEKELVAIAKRLRAEI